MKNLTPELVEKAKAAKSPEELLALAKANSIEITEEEAKTYFAQLGANGIVSDEELDIVAGGLLGCPGDEGEDADADKNAKSTDSKACPKCGATTTIPVSSMMRQCIECGLRFKSTDRTI